MGSDVNDLSWTKEDWERAYREVEAACASFWRPHRDNDGKITLLETNSSCEYEYASWAFVSDERFYSEESAKEWLWTHIKPEFIHSDYQKPGTEDFWLEGSEYMLARCMNGNAKDS